MSRFEFELTYDGPALSEHGMDVADLAPALLAFGDLVKQANFRVNGDQSKVNLIVQSNFEHKCFRVTLDIVQTLYESLGVLLGSDGVRTAKELAEWIGIGATATLGLIKFLALRDGRKIESVTKLESTDSRGVVQIKFEGDNNRITINQGVFELSNDPEIRKAAARVVAPVLRDGIDKISFSPSDGRTDEIITKDEARAVTNSHEVLAEQILETYEPQPMTAHIQVTRPDFDEKGKIWRFRLGDKVVPIDVSDTEIPESVRQRGYIRIGDTWRVKLEVTEKKTAGNRYQHEYKIVKVLEFVPGSEQLNLGFAPTRKA